MEAGGKHEDRRWQENAAISRPRVVPFVLVLCPKCGVDDDKVLDSRSVDDGRAIRRRRSCLRCSYRYTTFERMELAHLTVIKRSGDRIPFDADKIVEGVRAACKNRPVDAVQMEDIAIGIEERARAEDLSLVSTERIGIEVLDGLKALDEVAYLRFASVYKEFSAAADFAREARLLTKSARLLTKSTQPKVH